ncbi:hypothetical protein ACJZ2D_013528 [Fusarium nematophilum]
MSKLLARGFCITARLSLNRHDVHKKKPQTIHTMEADGRGHEVVWQSLLVTVTAQDVLADIPLYETASNAHLAISSDRVVLMDSIA